MPLLTLKAHFDGEHIMLDEPHDLRPGTQLTVAVLPTQADLERSEWNHVASRGLAKAYSDDEPDYTVKDIKP